jgi:hypothetical protein
MVRMVPAQVDHTAALAGSVRSVSSAQEQAKAKAQAQAQAQVCASRAGGPVAEYRPTRANMAKISVYARVRHRGTCENEGQVHGG